jgi:hypothetical protein
MKVASIHEKRAGLLEIIINIIGEKNEKRISLR